MSLDHTAIKEIRESESIKAANTVVRDLLATKSDVLALPSGFAVQSIENLLPGRTRYRGIMSTSILSSFSEYVLKQADDDTQCFIDADKMEAKAFFNLGSKEAPGHGDFAAILTMEKTAEFRSLLEIHEKPLTQKQLAEWIEDWNPILFFADAEGNAIDPKKAASAVRRITIESARREDHEQQDFKASRSAMESIEVRSEQGIPHFLELTCQPYKGLDDYRFGCRISILTGGNEPMLKVRIKQLAHDQELISNNFRDILEDKFFETKIKTYIGKFAK
jgi:uncharacterized protein YfdQ (DUF2303 family)